jgi:hypothetical protein
MKIFCAGTGVLFLALCPVHADSQPGIDPPPATSSVMVYIKVVIDKKFGLIARLLGGMKDHTWQLTHYDPANAWWKNPLIVYSDPPIADFDILGQADAPAVAGHGSSSNLSVKVSMVPHADVSVKTIPKSDGIKGTITTTISSEAQYYDRGWTPMVHMADKQVIFSFDTCDPNRSVESIGHETRKVASFGLERYTRNEKKWEPQKDWPTDAKSGDWRVVIHGKDAVLELTTYRYTQISSDAGHQ